MRKINSAGINYQSKIDDWKTFKKHNPLLLMFYTLISQKLIRVVKINNSLNDYK